MFDSSRVPKRHPFGMDVTFPHAVTDYPHFLPSLVPSENDILHDEAYPSRIVLPVVDPETTSPGQWVEDPEAFFLGKEETWTRE